VRLINIKLLFHLKFGNVKKYIYICAQGTHMDWNNLKLREQGTEQQLCISIMLFISKLLNKFD
jgi:hypothetical protein